MLHFWPEGVLQGLQSFFLQIDLAEIVLHKSYQPDAVVDLFDSDGLSGQGYAEIDLLVVQANAEEERLDLTPALRTLQQEKWEVPSVDFLFNRVNLQRPTNAAIAASRFCLCNSLHFNK